MLACWLLLILFWLKTCILLILIDIFSHRHSIFLYWEYKFNLEQKSPRMHRGQEEDFRLRSLNDLWSDKEDKFRSLRNDRGVLKQIA